LRLKTTKFYDAPHGEWTFFPTQENIGTNKKNNKNKNNNYKDNNDKDKDISMILL
jgi:hypothetical protein